MFLDPIFVKTAKSDPRTAFKRPKLTSFENREIAEILVKSVKIGLFGYSKRQNSTVFQDMSLKFCTRSHRQVLFTSIPFLLIKNSWKILEKNKILDFFNFEIFKTFKI